MSGSAAIPLVVLGGSDGRPVQLPPTGADHHALSGYKGVDLRLDGQPLVVHLVERFRTCRLFAPIVIAGPAAVYADVVPAGVEIVETDGSVGANVRAALELLLARPGVERIAFTACDVLPDPAELRALVDDYRARQPCAVWFPLIRAPRDAQQLGAFAWKPTYRIAPTAGAQAVAILPSHLGIVEPRALRLGLLYSLLEIAYRTRNRPVAARRRVFVLQLLAGLLYHDLLHVLSLRLPLVTWSVLASGLRIARDLRAGTLTREELERSLGRIVIKARRRGRDPACGLRLPVLDGLSLAKDIDTVEESRALAAHPAGAHPAASRPSH